MIICVRSPSSENIKVSDEALQLMADHGGGSFRDSVSLLDQASSHGQAIEVEDTLRLLGIPPEQSYLQRI